MAEALIAPPPGFELVSAAPPPPAGFEIQGAAAPVAPVATRAPSGPLEAIQSGWQGSATGLGWRGRLPELVLDPANSKWWERALSGIASVGSELPLMIPAGAAGGAAGTAAAGPVGGILGAGAGMFAVPAAIRETLIAAYKSGEATTPQDFWASVRHVAAETGKSAVVGAATFGAGAAAARMLGSVIAPAIGQSLSIGGAKSAIGAADLTAQIAAMTTMPAAFQGRLPELQEILDAAIIVGGMKAAHVAAPKIAEIFVRTGRTPAEVVADAAADPIIGMETRAGTPAPVEPAITVYHGSPYEFKAFDATKIGTGEGAQMFGHGLYVAENPKVATEYADSAVGGRGRGDSPSDTASRVLQALNFDRNAAVAELRRRATDANDPEFTARMGEAIKSIETGSTTGLYKIEIPQRVVDSMLDWDIPLSGQTSNIQNALKAAVDGKFGAGTFAEWIKSNPDFKDLQNNLLDGVSNAEVARLLLTQGITGIKYLDQFSREAKSGTRNYVLFDPAHARIVERNGKPLTMTDMPAAYDAAAQAETLRRIVPDPVENEAHALNIAAVLAKPFGEVPVDKQPNYLNFRYVEGPADMKAASARISEIFEQQISEARGKESWDVTRQKAEALLVEQARNDGKPLTIPQDPAEFANLAAKGMARLAMSQRAAYDVAEWARKVETDPSEANARGMVEAIETSALMSAADQGAGAAIARALAARKAARQTGELAAKFQELAAQYGGDPTTLAKMIGRLKTPEQINKFAAKASEATTWEKLVEAWKASILSGPVTQMANLIGNSTFAAMRPVIDAAAAAIGKVRGAEERVSAAEPFARMFGNLQGAKDALTVAAESLRVAYQEGGIKGAIKEAAVGKEPDAALKAEVFRKAISGVKGDIVRLPFRALSLTDSFFKTLNERGEAYTLATRQAVKEWHNPLTREFRERVVELVDAPTKEMQTAIDAAGLRFTFNMPLGEFGQSVSKLVRADPTGLGVSPLQVIVPFIRTPGNILKELMRLTPFAPLIKEWRVALKDKGPERDKALAELAFGTAISAVVISYAMDGSVTGAGEPDPGKKRVQGAAGLQPYSIKIGDTYYNYQRIQPVGTLIGMAADLSEVWDHMTDEEMDKVPKMLAVAFANAVTNQTFLQGITNLVNAASDPRRFAPRLMQQYAGSVVPAAIAQPTTMSDPVQREVNGMLDAIRSRVPGLRESLLPKIDVFGEPIKTKTRLGGISPVTETTESDDKVRTEAARLGISIADAPKKTHIGRGTGKTGDVELTPEERNKFAVVGGQMAHGILTNIVNAPEWDALPVIAKKRIYSKVLAASHKYAAAMALPLDKRLGYIQSITEKMNVELQPETEQ